jgi:site-specific DNA recombinase
MNNVNEGMIENVIVYCRVSSDEQALGSSLDVQEERIRDYCEAKGYNIIKVYRDDESAKTFEKRPEMMRIVDYIKHNKGQVQKLLFLRWDRFSRDLTSAMQYIQWFREQGVEPNAIECIVDYENEMWSLMLGMQIGLAQSDNSKRSKATRDGIHGTLKRGRCANKAPRGYKNVHISKHDKYVEIDEATAAPIRKAFQEVAKGLVCPCEVRRQYCPHIPSSSFLEMLRNVFYCGKIRVPQYKDEPEQIIQGVHEPLIDEATFRQVQDVLDGKKKATPKLGKTANPDLYLRKFLICPVCGHAITGSKSKGRNAYYTYYHCNDSKHIRVSADKVNTSFAEYVSRLVPNETVLALYGEILDEMRHQSRQEQNSKADKLKKELATQEQRLNEVEDMLIDGKINKDDFHRMKSRIQTAINDIQTKIDVLQSNKKSIAPQLNYSLSLLNNLDRVLLEAPVETKIKMLGSMFPEKIEFDGKNYRTASYNKVLDLIYRNANTLREPKNKKTEPSEEDSDSVPLSTIFSNPFLEDLNKLWELRHDIPDPATYGK